MTVLASGIMFCTCPSHFPEKSQDCLDWNFSNLAQTFTWIQWWTGEILVKGQSCCDLTFFLLCESNMSGMHWGNFFKLGRNFPLGTKDQQIWFSVVKAQCSSNSSEHDVLGTLGQIYLAQISTWTKNKLTLFLWLHFKSHDHSNIIIFCKNTFLAIIQHRNAGTEHEVIFCAGWWCVCVRVQI